MSAFSTAQWDRITRMAPCTPDQVTPSQEQPIMATPVVCTCNKKPGVKGRHKKNCAISQATSTRYPRGEQQWVGSPHMPTSQLTGTPCSFVKRSMGTGRERTTDSSQTQVLTHPVTTTISFTLKRCCTASSTPAIGTVTSQHEALQHSHHACF